MFEGVSNEQPTGAGSPSQQLGAVNREVYEPEIADAEFASSGEADVAPRDAFADFDTELPDDVLEAARLANYVTTREPENLDYVSMSGLDYGEDLTERVDQAPAVIPPVGNVPVESAGSDNL